MTANRSALPRDVRSLRQMVVDKEASLAEPERIIAEKETQLAERDRLISVRDAELYAKTLQIEHLKAQLAVLRRARFGRSSEKLDSRKKLEDGEARKSSQPDEFLCSNSGVAVCLHLLIGYWRFHLTTCLVHDHTLESGTLNFTFYAACLLAGISLMASNF